MGLLLRRPSDDDLGRLLDSARGSDVTYAPIGVSLRAVDVAELTRRTWATALVGPDAFARAAAALDAWAVHRGAHLCVLADGPLEVGTHVAMVAPLPIGFVEATCRIVERVDEPDRYGFAYGTLPVHPERGEESFVVQRDAGGDVRFTVVAVSRPVHPLARLAPPVAHALQRAAVRRYLEAMRAAAS
ncbi:MAG: DUF1990 domain-containing protein [Acidimicrobiales bacterium]